MKSCSHEQTFYGNQVQEFISMDVTFEHKEESNLLENSREWNQCHDHDIIESMTSVVVRLRIERLMPLSFCPQHDS
jgi:hypothetical protein